MQRLLFLHLEDGDVDVLAHLPGLDPRPEVLLVHPRPSEVVRHLADLAELPIAEAPPEPRADDVVVIPPRDGDTLASWVESFRRAGARILRLDDLNQASWPEAEDAPTAESEPTEASVPDEGSAATAQAAEASSTAPENGVAVAQAVAAPAAAPAPPPEIWIDPAATFRYLAVQAGGEQAAVTIWWDGGVGTWMPLLTTETSPVPGDGPTPQGQTLDTEYGRLVLAGDPVPQARAVTRVAEDVVLREVFAWRRKTRQLAGHGLPPEAGGDAARAWALPVLDAVDAVEAMLWRRESDGWHLLLTRGEEVRLSGELVLSEAFFEAGFGKPRANGTRWEPGGGLLIQLAAEPGDRGLPLRCRWMEQMLRGETGAW